MRKAKAWFTLVSAASLGIAVLSVPVRAEADVLLSGPVSSGAGEKMEGVAVSARAEGQNFTTSVFTDEQGGFYFPPLAEGKYRVWAQAVGFDAGRAEINLSGSGKKQDFQLKPTKDVTKQLSGDQWVAALPADTPQDRKMKEVFRASCVGCHNPGYILQNRFDAEGWEKIITLMARPGVTTFPGDKRPPQVSLDHFKKELAAYLGKVRGPESKLQVKVRPRPKGEATLVVVTEYDIPLGDGGGRPLNDGSDWSMGIPTKKVNAGAGGVHDAELDFYGNIWYTSATSAENRVRSYGKVNTKTGKVTDFANPGRRGLVTGSHGIARDPDGNIWFNVSNVAGQELTGNWGILGKVDPETDKFETFTPPQELGPVGPFLDTDLQGNVITSTKAGALRFDPKTKEFRVFKYVTPPKPGDGTGGPYGVTADAEGNLWWSEFGKNIEGKGIVATGKSEEIKLPVPLRGESAMADFPQEDRDFYNKVGTFDLLTGVPWELGPRRPGADKRGDMVWIPGWWGQNLVGINIHTNKMTMYPLPTLDSGPYMTKVDKDHVVWLNFQNSDTIAKFDPKTERWVEYHLPTLGTEIHHIGILDHNGATEVSLAEERTFKVAHLTFRTREQMNALKKRTQNQAQ